MSGMSNIWINDLGCLFRGCHLDGIFPCLNDEFEAPKSIIREAETTADRRPRRIAKESKIFWKEQIVDLLWIVA